MSKKVFAVFSVKRGEEHRLGNGYIRGEATSCDRKKVVRYKGATTHRWVDAVLYAGRYGSYFEANKRVETLPEEDKLIGIARRLKNGRGWRVVQLRQISERPEDYVSVKYLTEHQIRFGGFKN